ncbi:MAG TPA: NAD(P)-binding domain-containing protein [bacterium]|nr:NAD(P)-binding domain-containing protein [bacterium]
MTERVETVIIGGGQAGLAMSYHLSRLGREHMVLEEKWPGHRWRTERWDAFALQIPNWTLQLPGYAYQGDDPDGFVGRDEVAQFVEDYAAFIRAPVRCGVRVTALRQKPGADRLLVESNDAIIEAASVVVATGPYQRPAVSPLAAAMPGWVFQLHSSGYRNPRQLPPGAVLVVGSGASGSQITEDLCEGGRHVYLAAGSHRRRVRRYRGRDIVRWQWEMGVYDQMVENVPPEDRLGGLGNITGVRGGHDIDIRRFAADGVVLLGHLRDVQDGKFTFAADLEQSLARADESYHRLLHAVDDYIKKTGLDAPEPDATSPSATVPTPITALDLRTSGITSVVWSTGFRDDFGWIHLPVFDGAARPVHRRGVTRHPGVYFLGLRWLHTIASSSLLGVGRDAEYLAEHIACENVNR